MPASKLRSLVRHPMVKSALAATIFSPGWEWARPSRSETQRRRSARGGAANNPSTLTILNRTERYDRRDT